MGRTSYPSGQILISESTLCWDLSLVLVLTEQCLFPFCHILYLQKNNPCHYFLKQSIIYHQIFSLFSIALHMMMRYLLSVTASYCEKRKWSWMRDRLASRKQNSAFEENKNTSSVCHILSSQVMQPFIHMFLVPEESLPLPWPRDKFIIQVATCKSYERLILYLSWYFKSLCYLIVELFFDWLLYMPQVYKTLWIICTSPEPPSFKRLPFQWYKA